MKTSILNPNMTSSTVASTSTARKLPASLPPRQPLPSASIDPSKPMLKRGLDVHLEFIMAVVQRGHLSARAKITSGFSESFRRGIVTLPKIRNPKSEIRNKPEGPKSESQNQAASRCFEAWSFRVLNLFRISDFELRICRASNGGWPGVRIPPESRILFLHRP